MFVSLHQMVEYTLNNCPTMWDHLTILGMNEGRIICDGRPDALTEDIARGIYGVGDNGGDEEFSTAVTSTALGGA